MLFSPSRFRRIITNTQEFMRISVCNGELGECIDWANLGYTTKLLLILRFKYSSNNLERDVERRAKGKVPQNPETRLD